MIFFRKLHYKLLCKSCIIFSNYRSGERSPEILEWQNINRASASDHSVTVDRGISSIVIPTKSLNVLSKPEFLDHTFKPKP